MAQSDGDAVAKSFPTFHRLKASLSHRKAGRESFTRAWKRNRKWAGIFALVLLAGHMAWNIWASVTLNRELASLRAQGQPLRITEMAPPPIPDSRNAALVYLEAGRALELTDGEKTRIRSAADAANDRTFALASGADPRSAAQDDALLARNARAVTLVRQASAMTECRFAVDYNAEDLAGVTLKHLAVLRQLAGLMRIQAASEARHAKASEALWDAGAIFRISDALSHEPVLISGLVALAIQRIGYGALADVLSVSRFTPALASEARGMLPVSDPRAMMARDFQAERTFGLWAYGYVSDKPWAMSYLEGSAAPGSPWYRGLTRMALVVWSPWLKMDETYYLRYMNQALAGAATAPVPAAQAARFGDDIASVPRYAVIARIMSPAFANVLRVRDRCLVDRALVESAIAVNVYRAANGRCPAQLVEAVSGIALPDDPYSGKPLMYRTAGDTFTLYSVGADRNDNGGKVAKDTDGVGDIVWPGV